MRRRIPLSGLLLVMLAMQGCQGVTETPPAVQAPTEVAMLTIPFQETFADTEGAKRIVVCQFADDREPSPFVGEGFSAGATTVPRKYAVREDLTLVVPRILGEYLKQVGFNVSFADPPADFSGNVLRDVVKRHEANYLITGRLEELHFRVQPYEGQPILVLVKFRLDVYNDQGRLRIYYPARISDSEFMGDKGGDGTEIATLVNRTVHDLFARVFDDPYFVKALDLEPETVRELMKAEPVTPAAPEEAVPEEAVPEETVPEEAVPEETKPEAEAPEEVVPGPAPVPEPAKEMTEEEKAEQERLRKARELEEAIEETMEP